MLSREAVAAALALAGVRSGAHVLDLAPAAGLSRAALAAAGATGRVDPVGTDEDLPQQIRRYGYAIGVWSDRSADAVVGTAERSLGYLAPHARITLGSAGPLVGLVDRLRSRGWTVLHATSVPGGDASAGYRSDLALVAARPPR
jgi:hypothetical protein